MGFKVKIWTFLSILAIFSICLSSATSETDTSFHSSVNSFSRKIFSEIAKANGQKSFIYSPFSLHSSLAMVRMGADGQTAAEMDEVLKLDDESPENVATHYHSMLAHYENSDILKIANKIYVNQNYPLLDNYKELLTHNFYSTPETIDFSKNEAAANTINAWVESKTDKMIKNFVSPNNFNGNTRSFLMSALYFNGKWAKRFPKEYTEEGDFYIDETNTVKVQYMAINSTFDIRQSVKLDSAIVRFPYLNSNLSMVIVLPTERTGLAKLQEQLETYDLPKFLKKLKKNHFIKVRLPKFKIESEFDMVETLQKMGMNEIFGNANFSKMLKTPDSVGVDKVIHKAVIEVSEDGTTAAAASGLFQLSRVGSPYEFYADRPFFYAIVNEDNVPIFQGIFHGQ